METENSRELHGTNLVSQKLCRKGGFCKSNESLGLFHHIADAEMHTLHSLIGMSDRSPFTLLQKKCKFRFMITLAAGCKLFNNENEKIIISENKHPAP
jgi:hypothetical protein